MPATLHPKVKYSIRKASSNDLKGRVEQIHSFSSNTSLAGTKLKLLMGRGRGEGLIFVLTKFTMFMDWLFKLYAHITLIKT